MKMGLAVSQEILDRTTKCTKGFTCLDTGNGGNRGLCEVAYEAGREVLFLKSKESLNCPYRLPFGLGQICTCPTRYALEVNSS